MKFHRFPPLRQVVAKVRYKYFGRHILQILTPIRLETQLVFFIRFLNGGYFFTCKSICSGCILNVFSIWHLFAGSYIIGTMFQNLFFIFFLRNGTTHNTASWTTTATSATRWFVFQILVRESCFKRRLIRIVKCGYIKRIFIWDFAYARIITRFTWVYRWWGLSTWHLYILTIFFQTGIKLIL